MFFLIVGAIFLGIGGIWLLFVSFSESVLWGLGCIFLFPVQIIFVIAHWNEAKKPLGVQGIGFVLSVVGGFLSKSL